MNRVFWKDGGSSLAAVGSNSAGLRWLAPINWISIHSSDYVQKGVGTWVMASGSVCLW